MHEERKLNKLIKQDGIDTQSEILDELKRRYPQYVAQSDKKQSAVKKRKFAFIYALAVAACVAIVVPCAVLLPNKNDGSDNCGKANDRYCTQDEYSMYYVDYTIEEYRESNRRDFLYFDWYEFGEGLETVCYTSNEDNEVLCLEERVYLPEKDEFVQLSITKKNVYLSVHDSVFTYCDIEQEIRNHLVKWAIKEANSFCIVEDKGYRYFIQIVQGEDENRLFELVAELFETK